MSIKGTSFAERETKNHWTKMVSSSPPRAEAAVLNLFHVDSAALHWSLLQQVNDPEPSWNFVSEQVDILVELAKQPRSTFSWVPIIKTDF